MQRILPILLLLALGLPSLAQVEIGGGDDVIIDYGYPRKYTIGGVTVSGHQFTDANAIQLFAGIRPNDEMEIPGEKITTAIRNLWDQKLFSDVAITATKVQGNTIFLNIHVQEQPRLFGYAFKGISRGEADKIREMLNIRAGIMVTDDLIENTKRKTRNYFIDKGYWRANVTIDKSENIVLDSNAGNNNVKLTINVQKNNRVRIKDVVFTGNEEIPTKKLMKAMADTKPKRWYKFWAGSKMINSTYRADKKAIIALYNSKGMRNAKILRDTVYMYDKKKVMVEIDLQEGNKFYFRNIDFIGNTKYSDLFLSKILRITPGDVYNKSDLEKHLYMDPSGQDISSLYMDDGYLAFTPELVEVLVENDSIDMEIRIREGKQYRVNEVTVVGNTKTNDHVIMREIRTRPGDMFDRSAIIRTQRELANLGYFDPERLNVVPQPDHAKGTVDIEYVVEEKPSDQLELSGGWGGGRLVATLGLSFTNFSIRNIFNPEAYRPLPAGDGQRLSIRFQTNGIYYKSLSLSFAEPWLGGKKPNSFSVSQYWSEQTNGEKRYIKNSFGEKVANPLRQSLNIWGTSVGFGQRLRWPDDYFINRFTLSYQRYDLNNWNALFSFSDGVSNVLALEWKISRESVDQPLYPRSGSNVAFTVKATPPWHLVEDIDDYTKVSDAERYKLAEFHKWKFTSEWFLQLTKNKNPLVLRAKIGYGFLGMYNSNKGESPFDRFYLGGSALSGFTLDGREIISLRGYDDLSLSSPDGDFIIAKYSLELRYPLSLNPSATIYGLAFFDAGDTWRNFDEFTPFDVPRGGGFGLRLFLPMFGMMGLDYGWRFDDVPFHPFMPKSQFHFTIGMDLGEL